MIRDYFSTDYDPWERYVSDEKRDDYLTVEEDHIASDLVCDIDTELFQQNFTS